MDWLSLVVIGFVVVVGGCRLVLAVGRPVSGHVVSVKQKQEKLWAYKCVCTLLLVVVWFVLVRWWNQRSGGLGRCTDLAKFEVLHVKSTKARDSLLNFKIEGTVPLRIPFFLPRSVPSLDRYRRPSYARGFSFVHYRPHQQ